MPAPPAATSPTLTPELVQQMIINAFSALGLSGIPTSSVSTWYIDSGASNHMTHSPAHMTHIREYDGDLCINTADGGNVPITAVGQVPHSLPLHNVFLSPRLTTNLLSVGQLVDSNCSVLFSRFGCIVQDQVSGKVLAKGPKQGRLFPLQISSQERPSSESALLPHFSHNKCQLWHNRLGHPNSKTLMFLLNSGLINANKVSFKDVSFNCDSCKMGKGKTLPFPLHDSLVLKCFDIVHSDV